MVVFPCKLALRASGRANSKHYFRTLMGLYLKIQFWQNTTRETCAGGAPRQEERNETLHHRASPHFDHHPQTTEIICVRTLCTSPSKNHSISILNIAMTEEVSSSSWTPAQMKQVKSLLHDRQQCATVAGLTRDLQISRSTASTLLQHVVKESSASEWQATVCQFEQSNETHGDETVPCTGRYK